MHGLCPGIFSAAARRGRISSTSIIYADDFSDETEVMTEDEGTEEEDITDDSEIDFDSEEDASINEEQIEEDESEESQDEVTIEQ